MGNRTDRHVQLQAITATRARCAIIVLLCLLAMPLIGMAATAHFFTERRLPPPAGMYVRGNGSSVVYPNGIIISNFANRSFSGSVLPPSPGSPVTYAYTATWGLEISTNNGGTWQSAVVTGAGETLRLDYGGVEGAATVYTNQMLAFNGSGGGLPPNVMIRESPTLSSMGETRITSVTDGYTISSFFDIFTEVSTDGGGSWSPAQQAMTIELKADPTRVAPVIAPRPVAPMPNGQYVAPQSWCQLYASGIILRDVTQKRFTQWELPPASGGLQTNAFDAQLDFLLSTDGGATFSVVRAPCSTTFINRNVRDFSGQTTEEATVTKFDIVGGDLPAGWMIRESPTRVSEGGTARAATGGGYTISSFFDIFTEFSADGGQSWTPATNGPAHLELMRVAPTNDFPSNLLLPPNGKYGDEQGWSASFANGIVLTNVVMDSFADSFPPPAPGETSAHTCDARVKMAISLDGGSSFSNATAAAAITVQTTGRLGGAESTEYYDTEMLQLDVAGGDLPSGRMFRESPTKASLGRTTITDTGAGAYRLDSFFDVYLEVSTDAGMTWWPTVMGPSTVILEPRPLVPLGIVCPEDIAVVAPGAGGAVMSFATPATTGGNPPITVTCVPPSGSLFPIGTTKVVCTAHDAAEQTASCSFFVRVVAPLAAPECFFLQPTMPPTGGVYLGTAQWDTLYALGVVIRNTRIHEFSQGFPLPALGAPETHTFDAQVDFEISTDGGATFLPATVTAGLSVHITHSADVGGKSFFDTEMLQMDLTNGPLRLRESPSLASAGRMSSRTVSGGSMLAGFFDIWPEISLDGGLTWYPSTMAAHVELRGDPDTAPLVPEPTPLLLPPDDVYVSPPDAVVPFASGIVLKNIRHKLHTGSVIPPAAGSTNLHTFGSQVDLEVSYGGGAYTFKRAAATTQMRVARMGSGDDIMEYDTEMLSLDLSVGLPVLTVMVRESPTEPSRGMTQLALTRDGTCGMNSFFDVFFEISIDGGSTWQSSTNGPVRMELESLAPERAFPNSLLLPPTGAYVEQPGQFTQYASGIVVSNLTCQQYTQALPPPPPGGTSTWTFGATALMYVTLPAAPPQFVLAPANAGIRVASSRDSGSTRYFDTEMLQLDIADGTLPAGMKIRESPTKASLGRTSVRELLDGTYRISSFFDVFTEISTDGGLTWSPDVNGPATIVLEVVSPLEINPPRDMTVPATDWNGAVVAFPPPETSGGTPPITVTCVPPSGSLFPIGTTTVGCSAHDPMGQTASCSFTVTVVALPEIDLFPHSVARLTLEKMSGGKETIALVGPSRMEVYVGEVGQAGDTTHNGLDDAPAELAFLNLRGYSSLGPVTLRLAPSPRTTGLIEEQANNTPDILDVPPFTAAGHASSFFDVFAEIEIAGQVMHPATSFPIQATLAHKPPLPGEMYVTAKDLSLSLLYTNQTPPDLTLVRLEYVPATTVEVDTFPRSEAVVTLRLPSGSNATVRLTGVAKTQVYFEGVEGAAADHDGNGLDDVIQELVTLQLAGTSAEGPVVATLAVDPVSLGRLEELANNTPGLLDVPPFVATGSCNSFFDSFFDLSIGAQVFHNVAPWRLAATITHKPPGAGETLESPGGAPVPLFDEGGNPTQVQLIRQWHVLAPPELSINRASPAMTRISWPLPSTGYQLDSCSNLIPPNAWHSVTNEPQAEGGYRSVLHDTSLPVLFFRLRRPLP